MKCAIFALVLVGIVLMLSYGIETVFASSTMTETVQAGGKYTIWTDLNAGDKFDVSIYVAGGANNDVDLVIADPQKKVPVEEIRKKITKLLCVYIYS